MANMHGTYQAIQLGPNGLRTTGTILAEGTYQEVLPYWKPGKVIIGWNAEYQPIKRRPPETLGSIRRKRLMARLQKKCPLFAAQLYETEISARQEYFHPERFTD